MVIHNKYIHNLHLNKSVMWMFLLSLLTMFIILCLINKDIYQETRKYIYLSWEYLQNTYKKAAAEIDTVLDNVVINGAVRTEFNKLETAIDLRAGEIIADIDISLIQKRIKLLPWVEDAIVQRIFPDTIMVEVSEYVPLALWQHDSKYFVITDNGKILDEGAQLLNTDDVPLIVGTEAPAKAPKLLIDLAENPEVLSRLKAAVLVDGRRWNLILDNIEKPLTIYLPESDELGALRRLKKLQEKYAILKRKLTLIDLRLPEKLVVRL